MRGNGEDDLQKELRFLHQKKLKYGLHYMRYLIILEGYSDVNQISDIKDLKSTNRFIFIIE